MKSTGKIRFSIVIPCYNEESYISDSIKSLKNQDFKGSFEIIVVDNNSTDQSVAIAHNLGVKVIHEKKAGVCFARQAGSNVAKGEIIVSTDSDTVSKKDWLSKIDKAFKKNEKIIAVGGPCRYLDGPWWRFYTHFLFTPNYIYSVLFKHPFYITATNIAFKKSAFHGYYLQAMQGGDELYLLNDLKTQGQVKFLNNNPTLTSGRRLKKGLIYNLFVTFLFFYLGAYYLNRLFKREIIGSAPAFRANIQENKNTLFGLSIMTSLILITVFSSTVSPVRSFIKDNFRDTKNKIESMIKSFYS